MKFLILISLIITGCTVTIKPEADVEKALKQHSIVLDALVDYIKQCQAKGICPKPEVKDEVK